ncbi:MAG: hypothetical protein HGGPFJEG_02699 [Ignavibacteria bacterium]|nr:hypothetical protein [Ignavibacteria bacterium]
MLSKINYFLKQTGLGIILFALLTVLTFSVSANATTVTVIAQNFSFNPANINVNVGDTVKFQWAEGSHTTTCDGIFPGTVLPSGAASWNASLNSGSTTYLYKVTVAGTYNYVCQPHAPSMAGVIVASGGSGGALLTENFDYPAGDSLGAHGWVSFSGGTTNVLSVTSPGLTYSGYPLSGIGNAATVMNTGQDAYKNFDSPVDSTIPLYTSFMINVTAAQTGDYFFAFLPSTSTSLYTARFYAKDSSGSLAFGLSKSTAASGGIFYTGGNYSYGTTYLVVIKYIFVPGGTNDTMRAYIFPTGIPSSEPSSSTIGPVTGTLSDNQLGRIALRQGSSASSPTLRVDGFKVTQSWSSIVTSIGNQISSNPEGFSLMQNYPNPFNPSTKIRYSIPEYGDVKITVYDALGREIKNLVNGNLSSGVYETEFNGTGYNSGVYFYRLDFTGENGSVYSETKKLLLIK